MKKIKLLITGVALSLMASNANAWLLDGDNYTSVYGAYSTGKIKNDVYSSQILGFEQGRNFSSNWYGGLALEYGVYKKESNKDDTLIDLRASSIIAKIGYRPTERTQIYGEVGGMAGKTGSFEPLFGAGLRWNVFDNIGVFAEYRRISVPSSGASSDSYTINSGLIGLQLYLRY